MSYTKVKFFTVSSFYQVLFKTVGSLSHTNDSFGIFVMINVVSHLINKSYKKGSTKRNQGTVKSYIQRANIKLKFIEYNLLVHFTQCDIIVTDYYIKLFVLHAFDGPRGESIASE